MSEKSVTQLFPINSSNSIERNPFPIPGHLFVLIVALLVALGGVLLESRSERRPVIAAAPMQYAAPAPNVTTNADEPATRPAKETAREARPDSRYRALSEFLARRYNISRSFTLDLVSMAHTAGRQIGLDPLLIIAVMAVESRFNPIAESVAGAKGLMQIIPKYHTDKFEEFGGVKAAFDPEANILVGALILKEYLRRTGDLGSALQMYGGGLNDDEDRYTGKVMTEKERLQQVLRRGIRAGADTIAPGLERVNLASAKP